MKKVITVILSAILTLSCGLLLFGCEKKLENSYDFFSKKILEQTGIADIPQLPHGKQTRSTNQRFFCSLTEKEYNIYVEEIYNYFLEKEVAFFGTEGKMISIGNYEFKQGQTFLDFLDEGENFSEAIFVWAEEEEFSENSSSLYKSKLIKPNNLTVRYYKEVQTNSQHFKGFTYNVEVRLNYIKFDYYIIR